VAGRVAGGPGQSGAADPAGLDLHHKQQQLNGASDRNGSSYGRQIGRISDALELLIEERNGKTTKDKRFSDFVTMKHEIDNVKLDAAATRIEGITKDLAILKERDEEQYLRLRDALRKALK
jgi:hypothetical protein